MEEIHILNRVQDSHQEHIEVLCMVQGKERKVKVESQVKRYLRLFFANTKRFSHNRVHEKLSLEDWIVKEFIGFSSSEGTLKDSMTITTADSSFHSFVEFIQKNQDLGIRKNPLPDGRGKMVGSQ